MSCLRLKPGVRFLLLSVLLAPLQPSLFAQNEQAPQQAGVAGIPEVYDHGKFIDRIDIPGRILASKRVVKLTEDLFDPKQAPPYRHHDKGPDYTFNLDIGNQLKIKGIPMGLRGQSRKIEVLVEGKARTVVLRTNPKRGTSLEALVFFNGIPVEDDTPTAEDKDENRYIAREAVGEAIRRWASTKTTMTIAYVHYVYLDESEDFADDPDESP